MKRRKKKLPLSPPPLFTSPLLLLLAHLGQPRLVAHDELVGRHEHVELLRGHLGVEEVLM
jgi:hypothetical protein